MANRSSPVNADSPDGPCFYCGEPTVSYAGNPGLWPLRFCQRDGTGITRYHHTHCVTDRLNAHAQCAGEPVAWRWQVYGIWHYAGGFPVSGGEALYLRPTLSAGDNV